MNNLYHRFWVWWHRGEANIALFHMNMRSANYHMMRSLFHERRINNKKES
jgi:hypothetical protein